MSRSRRNDSGDSSLETLLDTICNTFGVVVFIAMLLVVQINQSRATADQQAPSPDADAALVEQQILVEQARRQLEQLTKAASQQKDVTGRFASVESRSLASQLRRQTTDELRAVEEKAASMAAIAQAQTTANRIAEDLAQQKQDLDQLRVEVAAIELKLETEVKVRSRTSKLPEGKETSSQQYYLVLKGGVLYRQSLPKPLGRNAGEMRNVTENGNIYVDPVPGTGWKIEPQNSDITKIVERIQGYPADCLIVVFFWPDSFAEFQSLKDALVQEGLRYEPNPVPDSTRLTAGGPERTRRGQ